MLVILSKLLGILYVIPFHELSLLPGLGRTLGIAHRESRPSLLLKTISRVIKVI
jgi:hypothetical protein